MLCVTFSYCYAEHRYAWCHYAECRISFFVMLNVLKMSVVMMNVVAPKGRSYKTFCCSNICFDKVS